MTLIDLLKVFDTIDHKLLLQKMKYLGFAESTINWFTSYLANMTFVVDVNGELSKSSNLTCSVPKGSIQGPLLFIIYVNDIPKSVSCDFLLYAEDSCLVYADNCFDRIEVGAVY